MNNTKRFIDCGAVYKELNENERSITHFITTPDIDRDGECVHPFGMMDADFSKAPSVFYNHNYDKPVAKSLWRRASDKGVLAKTKFGSTELAKDIYTLHKEDIIRTWSIGFRIPDISDAISYDDKSGTVHINKWELIEYSSAPVAMNPNCLDQVKYSVKSYELMEEIKRYEAFEKINSVLTDNTQQIKELRILYASLDEKLDEKLKQINEIISKLEKDAAGSAGGLIPADEVRRMFAVAVSSITGRKVKSQT